MMEKDRVDILLTSAPLDVENCRRFVALPEAGGQVVFAGAVRNHTGDRKVLSLEYEAYPAMAEKEMRSIAALAIEKYACLRVVVHHRIGHLNIGDLAVVIAVSAPHRGAGFDACQFIIDTLKKEVPIWKKEVFENGEEWISPRP